MSRRLARHRRARVTMTAALRRPPCSSSVSWFATTADPDASNVDAGKVQARTPVATIAVVAEPDLTLSLSPAVVPAGIIEVDYSTNGGTHTLVIDGVPGFQLSVPGSRRTMTSVGFASSPGGTCQCVIPGHQAAGEQVTLTVT